MRKISLIISSLCIYFAMFAEDGLDKNLIKEKIGAYYVNIAIANTDFGSGMNDVFNVIVRKIRPKTSARLEPYTNFPYLDNDGDVQYQWKDTGRGHRLYKQENGIEKEIELFSIEFSPEQKPLNKIKILKCNPKIYKEYKLKEELDVLGVMGVSFDGLYGSVEFINGKCVKNQKKESDPFPDVLIANADTMLKRYAMSMMFKNLDTSLDLQERNNANFGKMLAFLGEKKTLKEFVRKAEIKSRLKKIAGYDLPDIKLNIEYLPCIPNGNNAFGSPKAMSVPIAIGDENEYYIFVFPAAFSSPLILSAAIQREMMHIQWWLAAANLGNPTANDRKVIDDKGAVADDRLLKLIVREALLRMTVVHLEADIDSILKTSNMKGYGMTYQGLFFSHRYIQLKPLFQVINNPYAIYGATLPWTVSEDLIIPESAGRLHMTGSTYYNNALMNVMSKLEPGVISGLKTTVGSMKKSKNVEDVRMIDTLFHNEKAKDLKGGKNEISKMLVDAIIYGYTSEPEFRTKILRESAKVVHNKLTNFLPPAYQENIPEWSSSIVINDTENNNLVQKVSAKGKGFIFSDLEWLYLMIQKIGTYPMPFNDLQETNFGERLKYLVVDKKISHINGMRLWQAYMKVTVPELKNEQELLDKINEIKQKCVDKSNLARLTDSEKEAVKRAKEKLENLAKEIEDKKVELQGLRDRRKTHTDKIRKLVDDIKKNTDLVNIPEVFKRTDVSFDVIWPDIKGLSLYEDALTETIEIFQKIEKGTDDESINSKLNTQRDSLKTKFDSKNRKIQGLNDAQEELENKYKRIITKLQTTYFTGDLTKAKTSSMKTDVSDRLTEINELKSKLETDIITNYNTFYDTYDEAIRKYLKSGNSRLTDYENALENIYPKKTVNSEILKGTDTWAHMQMLENNFKEILLTKKRRTTTKEEATTYLNNIEEARKNFVKLRGDVFKKARFLYSGLIAVKNIILESESSITKKEESSSYNSASEQAKRAREALQQFVIDRNELKTQAIKLRNDIKEENICLKVFRRMYRDHRNDAVELLKLAAINESVLNAHDLYVDLVNKKGTTIEKIKDAFYNYFWIDKRNRQKYKKWKTDEIVDFRNHDAAYNQLIQELNDAVGDLIEFKNRGEN